MIVLFAFQTREFYLKKKWTDKQRMDKELSYSDYDSIFRIQRYFLFGYFRSSSECFPILAYILNKSENRFLEITLGSFQQYKGQSLNK
jgi:hypothetical protein